MTRDRLLFAVARGLALGCGVPIVPVSFTAPRFVELKTWDRLRFLLPFGAVEIRYGKPITPGGAAAESRLTALARAR